MSKRAQKKPTKSKSRQASPIQRFLTSLPDVGPGGFEGLVVRLLEATTHQRFRLVGSGSQFGRDGESESGASNRIKVEAKHYTSKLKAPEILSKLTEAVRGSDCPDLWVLATTAEVDVRLENSLRGLGTDYGVSVLLLDAPPLAPSRVEVLMAQFPDVVRSFISLHGKRKPSPQALFQALKQLARSSQARAEAERLLQTLKGTLLGYEDARQRAGKGLLHLLARSGATYRRFAQHIGVRDPKISRVERPDAAARLDTWWIAGSRHGAHAAVLAEEGLGKSWVLFDWLARGIEADEMPLVLSCNAYAETFASGATLESLLPQLLVECAGGANTEQWRRRLLRWLDEEDESKFRVLIAVDGLNERSINWISFFRPLQDPAWIGKVSVIVTDRPAHWGPACGTLESQGFSPISIGGYDDTELQKVLAKRNIVYEDIPAELHPLVRTPRYCDLVCEHFDELRAAHDFTIERLLYLDSRNRRRSNAGFPLSDEDFADIVRRVAQQYRQSAEPLSSAQLTNLLPTPHASIEVLQELTSSGILRRVAGRYEIERTRLVYGLGLLFAEDLRGSAEQRSQAHLDEEATRWLEPHPAMDIKSEICSAALFHAFLDKGYPRSSRRALLRAWLLQRNHSAFSANAFTGYVLRQPEDWLAVAEEFWTIDGDHGGAQAFLIDALCRHSEDPSLIAHLQIVLRRWLGLVHPAGPPFQRGAQDGHVERNRADTARRLGKAIPSSEFQVLGELLRAVEDDGLLRLRRAALRVISASDPQHFGPAFCAWAVSAALMGGSGDGEAAAWTIRLSDSALEPLLKPRITGWIEEGSELALQAARNLLYCLGSRWAHETLSRHPAPENEALRKLREDHAKDPCQALLPLSDTHCLQCLSREELPVHRLLHQLRGRELDPRFAVPKRFVRRAAAGLSKLDHSRISSGKYSTAEDYGVREVTGVLSTRAPLALTAFWRSIVRSLPSRDTDGRWAIAITLHRFTPVLGAAEIRSVRKVLQTLRASSRAIHVVSSQASERNRESITEAFLTLGIFGRLDARSQRRQLFARAEDALDLRRYENWFKALDTNTLKAAFKDLHSTRAIDIARSLWFLAASRTASDLKVRDRIVTLAAHDNPLVRGMTYRYIYKRSASALAARVLPVALRIQPDRTSWEYHWRAEFLTHFARTLPWTVVSTQLDVNVATYAFVSQERADSELTSLVERLNIGWREIQRAASAPQEQTLPEVRVNPLHTGLGLDAPEFAGESAQAIRFKDPSSSWSSGPAVSSNEFERMFAREDDGEVNERFRKRQKALEDAWKNDALAWFGRSFSPVLMGKIHSSHLGVVSHWCDAVFPSGPEAFKLRVRLSSFYVALMAGIWPVAPELALAVWKKYWTDRSKTSQADLADIVFGAPDGPQSSEARHLVLAECENDYELGEYVCHAIRHRRLVWLMALIDSELFRPQLWRRARALTMASFTLIEDRELQAIIHRASIAETWVASQLPALRENHASGANARYWYAQFCDEADEVLAWAAFQAFLASVDARYLAAGEIERRRKRNAQWKSAFVVSNQEEIDRAIRDRQRHRQDTLFGIRFDRGEVLQRRT